MQSAMHLKTHIYIYEKRFNLNALPQIYGKNKERKKQNRTM